MNKIVPPVTVRSKESRVEGTKIPSSSTSKAEKGAGFESVKVIPDAVLEIVD